MSTADGAGALMLDAEALYLQLVEGVRSMCAADTRLVGVPSGGAWLAERLSSDLNLPAAGVISSAMHRDDFGQRGLSGAGHQTRLGFDVEGADVIILDDVLYTGRTVRAALNELFDYGRPARVRLAVLVDRGGHELPIWADFAAARIVLPAPQALELARGPDGRFSFHVETR